MDLIQQLNHIFHPESIAIVGASANPDKLGYMCVSNLVKAGFGGRIYPINPTLSEVLGLRTYRSLEAVPDQIDLAIIVVPAHQTVSAVEGSVAHNAKGAVLIAGGFKETGTEIGLDLEARLTDIANRGGMKIIGPNTIGLLNPKFKLNASFQQSFNLCKVGNVALASQSGGTCAFITHAFTSNNIGISKATGLGNRCNLDFDEIVTYFGQDEQTKVISIYVEGLEQPQRFLNTAKQVARHKPIVAYKGGRSEGMSRATVSHTGTLAGKYDFYKAAFTQAGIIIVTSITELVDTTKALALQTPANNNRIAIISFQAGPGIITADKCRDLGLRLADFSPATEKRLRQIGYSSNAANNPVDLAYISWDFNASQEMLKAILEDNGVDGVIIVSVLFHKNIKLIGAFINISKQYNKPMTISIDSPGNIISDQIDAIEESGFPIYPLPERAATGMSGLARYGEILRTIG